MNSLTGFLQLPGRVSWTQFRYELYTSPFGHAHGLVDQLNGDEESGVLSPRSSAQRSRRGDWELFTRQFRRYSSSIDSAIMAIPRLVSA